MTLNPHATIFEPKTRSRLFSIYRPEVLTQMDASTSQDVADPFVPAKCPKPSSDSNSPTVSEQLHLLTTRVDQLKLSSDQALEQTKPLIQTFPLANIKQFQYLHAVQQQVVQFLVDLKIEKNERLKLCTTIRQLEEELTQLCRQVNEPSTSSLPIPFTVHPPCSAVFQDMCALNNAQLSKPSNTITLKRPSSTTSRLWLPDQQRGSPTQSTSGTLSSDLESRVKQQEEEITKAKNSRETIISIYRSQFTVLFDKARALESGGSDTIVWKLAALRLIFDTAKPAARLDVAATNPVLIMIALYTAHTLMAITSSFSSIHMV